MIQKACSLAQHHMWFERKVAEDRKMVAERLVLLQFNSTAQTATV